jgi:hypothetical protein
MLTLLLRDSFSDVMTDHSGVAAMLGRILCRTAEDFCDKFGDILEVSGIHIPK